MRLQAGTEFAGYGIEKHLGTGGMGTVYLARHPRLERSVALKVLSDTFTTDPKVRAAFAREASLAARLDHPNIVAVHDRSESDDPGLWLSMRYIPGGDANTLLTQNPDGLAPEQAVGLIADAAAALDFAHSQGVTHRDVKPANLLIEHDPRHGTRALLTDFGIARTLDDTVTMSAIAISLAYAAPERLQGEPADSNTDLYSLGCTFYYLLTGKLPFPGPDQAAIVTGHLAKPVPPLRETRAGLPAALDVVLSTAMAKDPRDRYPSCAAFADAALDALSGTAAAPTRTPSTASPQAVTLIRTAPLPSPELDPTIDFTHAAETTLPQPSSAPRRIGTRRLLAGAAGLLIALAGVTVAIDTGTTPDQHTSAEGTTAPTTTSSNPTQPTTQPRENAVQPGPSQNSAGQENASQNSSNPGGSNQTVSNSGGSNPGGSNPGGSTPDGSTPGGSTPDGSTPGGSTPDGSTPGGSTPDGSTPDGSTPGGSTPGGSTGPVIATPVQVATPVIATPVQVATPVVATPVQVVPVQVATPVPATPVQVATPVPAIPVR
ncbi:protein kinase domain-containing protein [Nocardia aurea]|uniref:non-specific serine/threonine protein kinase n=1 Tax=Nocardia aurea TaxID=2144174 RepID=A0ABV3G1N8_9NOCA